MSKNLLETSHTVSVYSTSLLELWSVSEHFFLIKPTGSQVSSPGKSLNLYPSNEYAVLPSGSEAHWEVVERILFIYAKLNPGIAYVQGMNEIVGPIYYTFATDPNNQWNGGWC